MCAAAEMLDTIFAPTGLSASTFTGFGAYLNFMATTCAGTGSEFLVKVRRLPVLVTVPVLESVAEPRLTAQTVLQAATGVEPIKIRADRGRYHSKKPSRGGGGEVAAEVANADPVAEVAAGNTTEDVQMRDAQAPSHAQVTPSSRLQVAPQHIPPQLPDRLGHQGIRDSCQQRNEPQPHEPQALPHDIEVDTLPFGAQSCTGDQPGGALFQLQPTTRPPETDPCSSTSHLQPLHASPSAALEHTREKPSPVRAAAYLAELFAG
jgi:hypothetical protein